MAFIIRSEEHTSELQSRQYLVCRLLLEKKKIRQLGAEVDRHNHFHLLRSQIPDQGQSESLLGAQIFAGGEGIVDTYVSVFFFNDTATTEIYTLSLHDALPIFTAARDEVYFVTSQPERADWIRSEEHTSELQSRQYLVCRLLLEKKKLHKARQRNEKLDRENGHRLWQYLRQ